MKFKPFTIGRYQFEELLAKGGMGEIYLVKVAGDQGFQKQFAVKRLIRSGAGRGNSNLAFEQEARVCSMLTHPNIAQVYDFVRTGKSSLLVMEYVNGRDLSQVLRQSKSRELAIPIPFAAYIAAKVAKGLEYAHTKKHPDTEQMLGIVHRDISPQNIMIALDGNVKLVDFGVARIDRQPFKTATGFIKGKPRYMSPEQARGEQVDRRTDIYGLGLVLLESLTGSAAFSGSTQLETFKKVQRGLWNEELFKQHVVPQALEHCIRRCLKVKPEERYATAFELGAELEAFLRTQHPGYGEHDIAEFLGALYLGTTRTFDPNREVVPFSQAEIKCMERGGLEESSLNRKPQVSPSFFHVTFGGIFESELSWILGAFVTALVLCAGFMAFQFVKRGEIREVASATSCTHEPAQNCAGKMDPAERKHCLDKENEKRSEGCRP